MTQLHLRGPINEGSPLTAAQHDDNMLRLFGFLDLPSLLSDAVHGYGFYAAGATIQTRAEGYRYEVAASGATDHHLVTSGGLKLYVLPASDGAYNLGAFAPAADDATDDLAVIDLAVRVAANNVLNIPGGRYFLGDTLHLHNRCVLRGHGEVVFRWPAGKYGAIVHSQSANSVWSTEVGNALIQRNINTGQLFSIDRALVKYNGNVYGPQTLPSAATAAQLAANAPGTSSHWRLLRPVDGADGSLPTWQAGQPSGAYPVVVRNPADQHNHYYLNRIYVKLNDDTIWRVVDDDSETEYDAVTRYGRKMRKIQPENWPRIGRAGNSEFHSIIFDGTEPTGSPAIGLWIKERVHTYGCTFRNFSGTGRAVIAGVPGEIPSSQTNWGNANVSVAVDCLHESNGERGFAVRGSDANGGVDMACRYINNGQWGVDNGCFLGHTFVGCETDGNGLGTSAGNNGKTSVVSYGGNLYRAVISETTGSNNGIMSESNRRLLATAQPGTNDSAWRLVEPGTPTPDYPLWTPGRELHHYTDGGGFKVSNSNGRHVMFGCRSGQREKNGNRITGPFAGNYGGYQPYFGGGGQIQSAYGGQINAAGLGASSGNNKIQFLENIPNGDILSIYRQDEDGRPWRLKWTGSGNIVFDWANVSAAFAVTGDKTTTTFGSSAPQPYVFQVPNGIAIGGGSNARRQTTLTAAPTTGAWARGDIVWNRDPSAEGTLGWICTASGTPGTWKTFGAIAA